MKRRFPKTTLALARLRLAWLEGRLVDARRRYLAAAHADFQALVRVVEAKQRLVSLRAELEKL